MAQYTEEDQRRARAMAAEVQKLRARGQVATFLVEVDLFDLFRVIGALQLAWRHPKIEDATRVAIEGFGAQLQNAFDADECPALAEVLEQGWHREFDR